jgi:glycosyltransferase involved in cell wall biosynthesis
LKRLEISLIATVRNEAGSVEGFLEGLLAQSRLPDEIVLVDGGSEDGTVAAIERMSEAAQVPIRLIEAPGSNISRGRNIAIESASWETIAVTDAGTTPRSDWLERLVEPLEADPGLAVAAGFFLPGGAGWRHRTLAVAITPQREEIDPAAFLPSSRSVAFQRGWWRRVGGYPEWLAHCEDLVFDLDIREAGGSFAFAPDAIVVWDARPGLRALARQYFNYARGDALAGLWPKRHLLRYSAYLAGLSLLRRRNRAALVALSLGWLGYQRKFLLRLLRIPPSEERSERLLAFAYAPVVVTVGDVAKMVGYAVGWRERISGEVSRGSDGRP